MLSTVWNDWLLTLRMTSHILPPGSCRGAAPAQFWAEGCDPCRAAHDAGRTCMQRWPGATPTSGAEGRPPWPSTFQNSRLSSSSPSSGVSKAGLVHPSRHARTDPHTGTSAVQRSNLAVAARPMCRQAGVPRYLLGMKGGEPTAGGKPQGQLKPLPIYLGVWEGPLGVNSRYKKISHGTGRLGGV